MAKETKLGKKIRTFQLKHEKTQRLDQAQYLSVSTGRLDPYLRELAITTLHTSREAQIWTDTDKTSFLGIYATALRARAAHTAKLTPKTHLLASPAPNIPTGKLSLKNIINTLKRHGHGLIIDPGYPTELTIEPHHLPELQNLLEQRKCESAFTPIGNETLHSQPPTDTQLQTLTLALAPWITQLNSQNLRLCACSVALYGFGASPNWSVLYLIDQNDQFVPFPSQPETALPALTICVDPALPGWERNILWEYRNQAVPIN